MAEVAKPGVVGRGGLYLQASMLVCFLAGSGAPMRLDSIDPVIYGFPPTMLLIVYGTYAFAALLGLLVIGSLSDYIGRRPVLIAAALLQVTAMWLFSRLKDGQSEQLMVARIVQGFATGGAASALSAGMLDVDRAKGAANGIAWMLGIALTGITESLLHWLPNSTRLVCAVFGVTFVAQAVGVVLLPEWSSVRVGRLAWLRPGFRVPHELRRPVLLAMPGLVASSTVLGFFCSVGPGLLRHFELMALDRASGGWTFYAPSAALPSQVVALDGLCLFAFGGSAALAVFLTSKRTFREGTRLGMVLLLVGACVTLLAIRATSSPLLFVACVVAGAGTGTGFQTAVHSVLLLTPAHQCAAVSSALYLVALPVAVLVAMLGHLQVYTAHEYFACVLVLCALALVGSFRWRAPELA